MNKQLQKVARDILKAGLAQLPESHHRMFKLMYGRNGGKRSVSETEALMINDVVDIMSEDKLDWAMQQVERGINNQNLIDKGEE